MSMSNERMDHGPIGSAHSLSASEEAERMPHSACGIGSGIASDAAGRGRGGGDEACVVDMGCLAHVMGNIGGQAGGRTLISPLAQTSR